MNVNTSTSMQPINTQYKGYLFRSRLEARWAKFFDAMGYEWEYEPEGFDMGYGDLYLPDFKLALKNGDTQWVEIKPKCVTSDAKFDRFDANLSNRGDLPHTYAKLVSSDPMWFFFENNENAYICPLCRGFNTWFYSDGCDGDHWMFECNPCDFNTPSCADFIYDVTRDTMHLKGINYFSKTYYARHLDRIKRAATAARSARFEQGAK